MNARQYWTVLREDRLLVAAVVVVCLLVAGLVSVLLPTSYTSTTVFYVASPQTAASPQDSYQGAQLSSERVKSYTELLTGERVATDASALLGGSPTPDEVQAAVSADAVSETVVLNLGVTESTPEDAQLVARAVGLAFTRLVGSIEATGQPVNRPIVTTETVLAPTLPTEPSGPGRTVLLALGLLAGLVLGIGAALLRRSLRRVVESPEAFGAALGAPVVGLLPGDRRRPRAPALLADPVPGRTGREAQRRRARAEAVRRMRTAVAALAPERRCLVLTGVAGGQRTTTTALDLAVVLAAAGEDVLLVDADLRDPALAALLSLDGSLGLAEVLEGSATPEVAIQRWAPGGIDVLAAGGPMGRPTELQSRADPVLERLRARYDRVVIDAPAATAAADAVDLAARADAVLVVARRGVAAPEDVETSVSALRLVGAHVLGGVLTAAVGVPAAPSGPLPGVAPRALPAGSSPG